MKLLLIADEITQTDWTRRRLELENNQVSVSTDWKAGLNSVHQEHYDVILLTIHLSENEYSMVTDWWPVKAQGMPLFLIVSPDTSDNKSWALECGADDCVGFSVDGRELNARLYALHRRKVGLLMAPSALRLDDLELNLLEKTAYRCGKHIDLLPREYYLLKFLMENQGRVVSKKEIMENVWHTTDTSRFNTIEVYINYLRNKIERLSPTKLIHTVTGMGYMVYVHR